MQALIKLALHGLTSLAIPLVWLSSYLIPKKRGMLVFGSKELGFCGNPKYLFLYSVQHTEHEVYFFTKSKATYQRLCQRGLPVIRDPMAKLWSLIRAEYIFVEMTSYDVSPFYPLFGRFKLVQLWHGTPIKRIEADSNVTIDFQSRINNLIRPLQNRRYHLICTADEKTRAHFCRAFSNHKVAVTGYPRNDLFFHTERSFDSLKNLINRDNYQKVILYAPTYRDGGDFTPFDRKTYEKLNEICHRKGYLFILKEHPFKRRNIFSGTYSNLRDLSATTEDIQELLVLTDILITDYSSVCFDYALRRLPIIYFTYDYEEFRQQRELYFDIETELPGPFAEHTQSLLDLIEDMSWWQDAEYQASFEHFRERFNRFRDGNASRRVLAELGLSTLN